MMIKLTFEISKETFVALQKLKVKSMISYNQDVESMILYNQDDTYNYQVSSMHHQNALDKMLHYANCSKYQ